MSGWDDLGSTLNDAAQTGAKKAGKWFEIGKLHMQLASAELDLKEIYEKIGDEIYHDWSLHRIRSPKLDSLLEEAFRQERKVKKIKEKLLKAEGRDLE